MAWKDNLRAASFRGITFQVEESENTVGAREVVSEYPLRQTPLVEWLGRKARTYRITGFLVGENYAAVLAKLVRAFEKPPAGYPFRVGSTLVHPYLGEIRVVGQMLRYRETFREGRMVRLEMQFVEAGLESGKPFTPSGINGKAAKAKAEADAISGANVEENMEVEGAGESAFSAITEGMAVASNFMKKLDVFSGIAADVAAFGSKVNNLVNQAKELAAAPANMVASFKSTFASMEAAIGNASGVLSAYEGILDFDSPTIDGVSAAASKAASNSTLFYDHLKVAAAGGAVVAGVQVEWDSLDDAITARDRILTRIDDLMTRAPDSLYASLQDLRISAANGMPRAGADLPSVVSLTLERSVPALVLASRLYDQPRRDAGIIRRNQIAHPLFVPGGVPLEVLSE